VEVNLQLILPSGKVRDFGKMRCGLFWTLKSFAAAVLKDSRVAQLAEVVGGFDTMEDLSISKTVPLAERKSYFFECGSTSPDLELYLFKDGCPTGRACMSGVGVEESFVMCVRGREEKKKGEKEEGKKKKSGFKMQDEIEKQIQEQKAAQIAAVTAAPVSKSPAKKEGLKSSPQKKGRGRNENSSRAGNTSRPIINGKDSSQCANAVSNVGVDGGADSESGGGNRGGGSGPGGGSSPFRGNYAINRKKDGSRVNTNSNNNSTTMRTSSA
jgi:hypothetical protein